MSSVNLETMYPNIFKLLEEEIDELRYLVVVDKIFDDVDSDEFDAIDPEDYNYLVYVTERIQDILGEEGMVKLVKLFEAHASVELFYLSDIDLYGIQTKLEDEEIAHLVLTFAEELALKIAA